MTSNAMSHTPGPWVVDGFRATLEGPMGYTIRAQGGWICDIPPDRGHFPLKAEINARLIAAAPEMREDLFHTLGLIEQAMESLTEIGNLDVVSLQVQKALWNARGSLMGAQARIEHRLKQIDGGDHA